MDEGLILGRYRPLGELGEGGHGAVELAFDTKMARRVAIKRIPVSHRGIQILSRTTGLKEARTAALLNHPNIVTVHEWDTDEDEAFLIMEHVDGVSLAELLDCYAPLEPDEAAAVLGPVADAVAFAHENGVLHLDLKPENVLVTRDGLVKVADFGVAALTNAAGQAISAGGTLGYMPPEQLRGETVDTRTDVWAFASLSFQVMTGAVPYASDTIEGALFKIEQTGVPLASEYEPSASAVDDILDQALSAEPDERPESVRELADALLSRIGDPATGRPGLRSLAMGLTAEEEAIEEVSLVRLGLWDRLASRSAVAGRASAAMAAGWLGWIGASPLGMGWPPAVAAVTICAAAGWFAPSLGLGAGLVLLTAGAFSVSWQLGAVIGVIGAAWWALVGRIRPAAGAAPAFAPLAGVLRLSPALPVLTGFFSDGVLAAGAGGALSGLVLVTVSLAGRAGSLIEAGWPSLVAPLAAPGPGMALGVPVWLRSLAIVVGWGLAGMLSSLGSSRGTRLGALTGAAAGMAACAAAIGPWVTGGSRMAGEALLQLCLGSILVLVVIALGPPVRGDDSDDTED